MTAWTAEQRAAHSQRMRDYWRDPAWRSATTNEMRGAWDENGKAQETRRRIFDILQEESPLTADEIAIRLELSVLYVRPRVCELVKGYYTGAGNQCMPLPFDKRLVDSGERGRNWSGRPAIKWKIAA